MCGEEIREQGLKYLSSRLNYLQALPCKTRPAHALGEGAHRATKNQLRGSTKLLIILGLNVDSRLSADN